MSEQYERIAAEIALIHLKHQIGAVYKGDRLNPDANGMLLAIAEDITALRQRAEAAEARVQALEAANAESTRAINGNAVAAVQIAERLRAAEAENARLLAALKQYGVHKPRCTPLDNLCWCGLDAALTEPRREEEREPQ